MNGITQATPEQGHEKTPMVRRAETVQFAEMLLNAAFATYPEEHSVSETALKDTVAYVPDTPMQSPVETPYADQSDMENEARNKLRGLYN